MFGSAQGALVGRAAELDRMRELVGQAADGQPVVILVSGDAGVGKTRLLSELARDAASRGFTVLSGHCAELADTVPYLPLADALRGAATGQRADGPLQDALAARPVLALLLPDREITRQPGDVPGLAQQQLFGAVLGMLTELAEANPVLLILEDLHWADRSTRDLVTFLSRMLHTERIALALSYRTDDLHRGHPLRQVVAELQRLPSVTAIEVGPLDAAAMAEHLTSLSGGLDAAALDRLISRAEGNPYYGEELLATASAGGELPAGLADVLLARTIGLPAPAQHVLRVAAVAGRRVDDELVMRASGLAAAEYEDAVRQAVTLQLLVPDGLAGLAFRHALLREAIYSDLLPGERTRLHARLAELLADERRLSEVPGSAAELALHCMASHDIPGAFAASVQAGREAERLAAPAEAHRHYDQALSLWERVAEPAKVGATSRGKLAFRSALNAADSGQVGLAVRQLRRLLGFLQQADEPELQLICRVKERLGYFLLDIDQDAEALAMAGAAADVLPAEPPTWERARALATHARAMVNVSPDTEPARARAEEAVAAASAADAPWVQADALVTLSAISERAGRITDAVATSARAIELASQSSREGVELRARTQLARVQLEWGDLAAASETAHQGTRLAERAGLSMAPFGLDLQYLHYLAHFADGDWDHAQEIADRFAVRVNSVAEARLSAMALFIDVARGSQRVAERRAWLERFMTEDWMTEYIASGLFAEDAYWSGDLDGAVAAARATIHAADAWGEDDGPQVIRPAAIGIAALGDQARYARAGGRSADPQIADARSLAQMARNGMNGRWRPAASIGVDGRGWHARAEAELSRAEGNNDPRHWREVVDTFGPGFVYETARSRWRLAEALAEAGDRDQAQQEWLLAASAADELGAARLRAALADLGRRARLGPGPGATGLAVRSGRQAVQRSPLSLLTARELEVLRALAAGRSNKEIAAELFITAKTVSVHVSNILAKLGAASRTEAAVIAHGNGIATRVG